MLLAQSVKRLPRSVKAICALGTASVVGYAVLPEKDREEVKGLSSASLRILRLVSTVGVMAIDYGYVFYIQDRKFRVALSDSRRLLRHYQEEEERLHFQLVDIERRLRQAPPTERPYLQQQLDALYAEIDANDAKLTEKMTFVSQSVQANAARYAPLHLRNAQRLRDMCLANRGLYVKLGQHLALLDYVFPKEYGEVLAVLFSSNLTSSFPEVRQVFREELGVDIEDVFDRFEEIPMASASLAQVHLAEKDGHRLAVKVVSLCSSAHGSFLYLPLVWCLSAFVCVFVSLSLPLSLCLFVAARSPSRASTSTSQPGVYISHPHSRLYTVSR